MRSITGLIKPERKLDKFQFRRAMRSYKKICVLNIYATNETKSAIFKGFPTSQNVNKEMIFAIRVIARKPIYATKLSVCRGHFLRLRSLGNVLLYFVEGVKFLVSRKRDIHLELS